MIRYKKCKRFVLSVVLLILCYLFIGCSNNSNDISNTNGDASQETNVETSNNDSTKEANNYPEKTIEIIVPFGPGGVSDQIARVIERYASKYLPNNQSLVVINKGGGAAVPGATEVANAKPDGYTLGLTADGPLLLQPIMGNTPYTKESFQPIIRITTTPQIFAVHMDSPFNTFEEWLEYVKANPDTFVYGSPGIGITPHIAMEKMISATGIKIKHTPFDSTAEVYTNLLGKHVDGECVVSQEIKNQLASGKVKVLANLGSTKEEATKDIPTMKELGYDISTEAFFGIVAPKDTPDEIIQILHDAFKKTLEDPEAIKAFETINVTVNYADPEEFQKQIAASYDDYNKVIESLGLKKK